MADRNALARATEQSSSPTPGYLYNDIAKQSASSPSISSEILSYLLRRLAKNNAHVKYKTLKTISMVSSNPNSRGIFKRIVVQDTQAISDIKGCLNYRGKPDAVHGDELFDRVRVQAKETLDAVYSDEPSSSQMQMGGMSGGGIGSSSGGGYGQSSGGGYSGGGAYGGSGGGGYGSNMQNQSSLPSGPKRMEGIGNPMFKDPRMDQPNGKSIGEMTISDVAAAAVEGFKGIVKDPLARNVPAVNNAHRPGGYNGGGYGAPTSSSGQWSSAPPGQSQLASATNGQWTMASNRGPTAISSGVGGSWGAAPSVSSQSRSNANMPVNRQPVVNISGHPGAANTSGTFEKNMIMELCPPGGMKPEPPADKLTNFCQSLSDLNSDLICPALLDMLEEGQPWIIRAKVLCVMEKCVMVGNEIAASTGGNNVYADFFHMCHEEITPLASHSRAAVREPAKRVCKALGLNFPAFASSANAQRTVPAARAQPQVEAPNLLDFDDAPQPTTAPPPVPTSAPPPMPPVQAPPVPAQVPVAAPPVQSGNMFGGMNMKSVPVPAPVVMPPAPPAEPASDFFGEATVSAPQATSAPAVQTAISSELFGDMTIKPAQTTTVGVGHGKENIENAVQAPASSGFSFLNSGSAEPTKAAAAPTPAPPAKETFDPLLSMGPSSSSAPSQPNQAMAMTPQMAMVMQQQQQQILMMQAQMQQMQMAGGGQQQRFMMMSQQQRQSSTGTMSSNTNVMGAMGGHGVNTSFAFMEDPTQARRDASNKKFDFVQDAMKGAK